MSIPDDRPATSPEGQRFGRGTKALVAVIVAVAVALGVWVTGAVITDNEQVAKGLTGLWLATAGAVVLVVAWRWRPLAIAVIATYVVVAGGLGGFLLYSSTVDKVVDEDVVVAEAPAVDNGSGGQDSGGDGGGNVEVAAGEFVSDAHPTSGTASVIETAEGGQVLTLTDFETDPGPDLRLYLVPKDAAGVEGGVDLGALKGNRGNQQYDVPEGTPIGSVVIWCRAFTVTFGQANLA